MKLGTIFAEGKTEKTEKRLWYFVGNTLSSSQKNLETKHLKLNLEQHRT